MQPGFFEEEQGHERNDAAGEPDEFHAGEQAGRKHHESCDLRRTVDILATACDVRRGNNGNGSGEQDRRGNCDTRGPQPSAKPADGAEHREGSNAREPSARALGVSGPLALQTYGRTAQRSYQQPNDVRGTHRGGELDGLPRFLRAPVQHVAETAVEPRLTGCVVMLWIDRLVVDVREVATQARDLLHEPAFNVGHQLPIALIPQLVTMRNRPWDTTAVRLDGVFRYEVRVERWQFPMPEHDLGFVVIHAGSHKSASVEDCDRASKDPRRNELKDGQ